MKRVLGFFLALIICILMGLLLPIMRQDEVSLTRDEHRSIFGDGL